MKKKPLHSQVGASSMDRWSNCPGSVALCAKMPKETSVYAEEGTRAHELAAYLLTNELPPNNMEHEYDEETLDAVYVYVNYVNNLWKSLERHDKSKIMIEHKFDVPELHEDFHGTADCVIYDGKNKKLYVIDYKHGMGVPVSPEGNQQLMYYGIGAVMSLKLAVEEVELAIVQPRYSVEEAIKTWKIDSVDLLEFGVDVVEAIKRTEVSNAPTRTGDHCKFCSAKPICPSLRSEAEVAMKAEFALAELPALDQDSIGNLMDKLETIEAWAKGVREFAYQQAKVGRIPTGWKVVPKRAMRRWADPVKALTKFEQEINRNLVRNLLTEPELKSPAQVEKILGSSQKALVDSLTVAISSGDTLVPESDKRQAVNKKQIAEQMFND